MNDKSFNWHEMPILARGLVVVIFMLSLLVHATVLFDSIMLYFAKNQTGGYDYLFEGRPAIPIWYLKRGTSRSVFLPQYLASTLLFLSAACMAGIVLTFKRKYSIRLLLSVVSATAFLGCVPLLFQYPPYGRAKASFSFGKILQASSQDIRERIRNQRYIALLLSTNALRDVGEVSVLTDVRVDIEGEWAHLYLRYPSTCSKREREFIVCMFLNSFLLALEEDVNSGFLANDDFVTYPEESGFIGQEEIWRSIFVREAAPATVIPENAPTPVLRKNSSHGGTEDEEAVEEK